MFATVPSDAATVPIRLSTCDADRRTPAFLHSLAVGFEPDTPILIHDDLSNLGIADCRQNSRPELAFEQFV